MLRNNVFKTRHLLDLLKAHKPEHFFCVSTDKAANPVSVMGASKKLMEQLILSYSSEFPVATARFANVAFSNGSLPAGFLERIMKRQPLSAPLDVERYFVSPEESGQLCLLACILGISGDIFFPKLDAKLDVRRFSEISTALLQTLGFEPDICSTEQEAREKAAHLDIHSKTWPVYYFNSETSGEKALEEFFTETEAVEMSQFAAIGVVKNRIGPSEETNPMNSSKILAELEAVLAMETITKAELVLALKRLVPDFQHLETGKSLDQKM
jgi:FlaA1/EpsC-like NDP-sugar epimerase